MPACVHNSADWSGVVPADVFDDPLPPEPRPPLMVFGAGAAEIEAVAQATGAPVGMAVNLMLALHAAALPPGTRVRVDGTWIESKELFFANVGRPGTNKSPLARTIMAVMEAAQWQLVPTYEAADIAYLKQTVVAKAFERRWLAEVRKAVAAGTSPPDCPPEATAPPRPRLRRLVVTNASQPKLLTLAADSPLYFGDEATPVIGSAGTAARAWTLQLNAGDAMSIDRMTGDTGGRFCGATILVNLPPDRMATLLSDEADGLVERMLVAFCDPAAAPRPERHPDWSGLADGVFALTQTPTDPVHGREHPLDDEARRLFMTVRNEYLTAPQAGRLGSYTRKGMGMVLRLALALEYFHWRTAGCRTPHPTSVTARSMAGALAIYEDFYLPMFRRVLALVGDGNREAGQVLAHWIIETRQTGINAHALKYGGRIPGLPRHLVDPAIEALVSRGWLRRVPPPGTRGAPSKTYSVNPRVFEEVAGA